MSPINNDEELIESVAEAGRLLQEIADFCGRNPRDDAKVRFPRGYLRTAHQCREAVKFVTNKTLRTNLAYHAMLSDVYQWLLTRTDISGTARDMLVKSVLVLNGGIAEALVNDFYDGVLGHRQRFTSKTKQLRSDELIDDQLKQDLDWVWEMRNRQHLFELDQTEFYTYAPEHVSRAQASVNALVRALAAARATKGST